MSEINFGKPPTGEAGMCMTDHAARTDDPECLMPQYWMGDIFADSANKFSIAWNARGTVGTQERPWRWATFAEVSAEVGEWMAREMVHHSQLPAPAGFVPPGAEKPWYPPVPEGFGPWVEWHKAVAPTNGMVTLLYRVERERKDCSNLHVLSGLWLDAYTGVVAYCASLEDQPTQEQVEATQQPWSLEQDAADYASDAELQNRPMFDADDVGVLTGKWDRVNARQTWQKPTAAPGFMVRDVRSSDGLLTVREADHRLGDWQ